MRRMLALGLLLSAVTVVPSSCLRGKASRDAGPPAVPDDVVAPVLKAPVALAVDAVVAAEGAAAPSAEAGVAHAAADAGEVLDGSPPDSPPLDALSPPSAVGRASPHSFRRCP